MKKSKNSNNGKHVWRFFRAGGFDQVTLGSGKDLESLDQLDQKLWVALACPVDNLAFDKRTLQLIDTDNDKRIRVNELVAAVKWVCSMLHNSDELLNSRDGLCVSSVTTSTDKGVALVATIKNALELLGKSETDALTVVDVESLEKKFSERIFNGDGIITDAATESTPLKECINRIARADNSIVDRNGAHGVSKLSLDSFFGDAKHYRDWQNEYYHNKDIALLGDRTAEAAAIFAQVKGKIDDYFTRCSLAKFDPNTVNHLNSTIKQVELMNEISLTMETESIALLPLSHITEKGELHLTAFLNPAWKRKINLFNELVISPSIGQKESLLESQWQGIVKSFEPWFSWQERKPSGVFTSDDASWIDTILNDGSYDSICSLIEKDNAQKFMYETLLDLERIVRYYRDIFKLCCNFVNFKEFYTKDVPSIFQMGTLYLDQRSCNLCMRVDDVAKHSLLAAMASTYLLYCDCKRVAGAEKMTIVAALTNGDSQNLFVGRNGLFYDRAGNDWDATVTKIIENPISIRQAFWLPYKNLVRMIEEQTAKRAIAADSKATLALEKTAVSVAQVDLKKQPVAPQKIDIGSVAAIGVAAGALGTFAATSLGYVSGIVRLGPVAIVSAFLGLILMISGPSLALAFIKLRKRNVGPILDANGWATNARARINVPFGTELTRCAMIPPLSQRDLFDPFAEKKSLLPKVAVAIVILLCVYAALNHLGFIHVWSKGLVGTSRKSTNEVIVIEKSSDGKAGTVVPVAK